MDVLICSEAGGVVSRFVVPEFFGSELAEVEVVDVEKPVCGFADIGAARGHCPLQVTIGQVFHRHLGVVFLVMMHLA